MTRLALAATLLPVLTTPLLAQGTVTVVPGHPLSAVSSDGSWATASAARLGPTNVLEPIGLSGMDVSDSGLVCGYELDVANGWIRACTWDPGGLTFLDVLPVPPVGSYGSIATSISADGAHVVGRTTPNRACHWSGGTQVVLDDDSFTFGVSDDGTTIAGIRWPASFFTPQAIVWYPGGTIALPFASPSNPDGLGEIEGLSPDGRFVVGREYPGYPRIWSADTGAWSLVGAPNGTRGMRPMAVANGGRLVVGQYTAAPCNGQGRVWTPAVGVQNLPVFLAERGVNLPAGQCVDEVRDVSADGTVLVGGFLSGDGFRIDLPHLGVTTCTGSLNSTGRPAELWVEGSPVVAKNRVVLTAHDLPPNQFGYFLCGPAGGLVPNPGGSQGTLCLSGTIGRFTAQLADSGPFGSIRALVDLTNLPTTPAHAVLPGETWHFQCWYRDENPTATSNFSQAVAVTFQ